MDRQATEKMESLKKYVPFIDFLLEMDKQKYIKFINIRKWIVLAKKKYPISDLNKIEQSIITQYKNLLVENNLKIPENIANIFEPMKFRLFINLCSDEEDDDHNNNTKEKIKTTTATNLNATKEKKSKVTEKKYKPKENNNKATAGSDDDLEIVSIDYLKHSEKKSELLRSDSSNGFTKQNDLGIGKYSEKKERLPSTDTSNACVKEDNHCNELLNKIDKLFEDDLKINKFVHEPINYTYQEKDFSNSSSDNIESAEGIIYERRTTSDQVLFKRRNDFKEEIEKSEEVIKKEIRLSTGSLKNVAGENFENNKNKHNLEPIEIISLDSDNDDDQVSTPKTAALKSDKNNQNNDNGKKSQENIIIEDKSNNSSSNSKKTDELCESINSVFRDMAEILEDLDETEEISEADKTYKQSEPEVAVTESNSNDLLTKTINSEPTGTLTEKQIHQLIEDLTNRKDFDMDTFYAALSYVKQMNVKSDKENPIEINLADTIPPAPPQIENNLSAPHIDPVHQQNQHISSVYPLNHAHGYLSQQQQQSTLPFTPYYAQNQNFTRLTSTAPHPVPRPKININDPRIMKQLQTIQNSPLFACNILNPEIASSIMQACQLQTQQLNQLNRQKADTQSPQSTAPTTMSSSTCTSSTSLKTTCNPSISAKAKCKTYGEYRRWKEKLEMERKRVEHTVVMSEKPQQSGSQELLAKKDDDIRSKILSTLNPCCKELTSLWRQQKNLQKNLNENKSNNRDQENQKEIDGKKDDENTNKNVNSAAKESKHTKCTKERQADTHKKLVNNSEQKLNRVYNELKCTMKGFNQLDQYIYEEPVDNRLAASEQSAYTPNPIGLRRRSSIFALSAITEQLAEQSSDSSESNLSQNMKRKSKKTMTPKRRSTNTFNNFSNEIVSDDSTSPISKRRKTIDEIIKPTKRSTAFRIIDDETLASSSSTSSFESNGERPKQATELIKEPIIKLHRLSESFIRQHIKGRNEDTDSSLQLRKNSEKVLDNVEPASKGKKLKRYNNDCQMTERNTLFCVLCKSKPSDLTNHYIGRHKTESYVSRLDWSEMDDLQINTPFAKLQPKSKNYRFDRYEVECAFCKEKLLEPFMHLYNHYSAHTGEYAFQCSHCNLTKPYRPDIQSHILHSKTCRNSTTQIIYRYPPNAQCIYLHYCTICNFVQLNEANVLKHLREHHDSTKAVQKNIQKCILAVMSDGPDVSETTKSPTPIPIPVQTIKLSPEKPTTDGAEGYQANTSGIDVTNNVGKSNTANTFAKGKQSTTVNATTMKIPTNDFKVDDDDIPVTNEPCLEDEFAVQNIYCLEDQLKMLHEGPTNTAPAPMTVVHCLPDFANNYSQDPKTSTETIINSLPSQSVNNSTNLFGRHLPMIIKSENMDIEENRIQTPPRTSSVNKAKEQSSQAVAQTMHYTVYEKYRSYPQNVNYLGLYKCMIDDCYYSTDCPDEFSSHLTDHLSEEVRPVEVLLQCPYCIVPTSTIMTPQKLVEHVRSQHGNSIYQCSLCCYRSCDASNVQIHQQMYHNSCTCKVYKCPNDLDQKNELSMDLKEIEKNILKSYCKVCSKGFYHTQLLIHHLNCMHNVHSADNLKFYSCIYCPLTVEDKSEIRIHVATKHPGELPCIYDRNTICKTINEDTLSYLNISNLTEVVACEEINSTNKEIMQVEDIKPDIDNLLNIQEETIKVRLRKLTAHTGISPDTLYRCPITACGGIFSTFNLWLKHVKVRHHSLECQCPHCPTVNMLKLEEFGEHFEKHRRHTFFCFHCTATFANEKTAQQHANENHVDLGPIRFEQILFNLNYSYNVMLKSTLFIERPNFIREFTEVLNRSLKDLESNELQKFKNQWPIQKNTEWLDDYLELLPNRRVVRTCLIRDCQFRARQDDILFNHLRSSHDIRGNSFNCSKCSFSLKMCTSFDEVFDHIKLHNDFICICAACSLNTSSRSKMCGHIQEQHNARDVPVVVLFKTISQMFVKVHIVFANNHLTFSTMKNCFCCSEKNMSGDVFGLHLKRYHKFSFTYCCEQCPNFKFQSLKDVKPHFQQQHSSNQFKIRCELASPYDLNVTSLNDFQMEISMDDRTPEITTSSVYIKEEPIDVANNSDDVFLLEDNDVIIKDVLKSEQQLQHPKEVPIIKCASLSKLIKTPSPTSSFQPNASSTNQGCYQLPTPFPTYMSSVNQSCYERATTLEPLRTSSSPSTYFKPAIYLTNDFSTLKNHQNVFHTYAMNPVTIVPTPSLCSNGIQQNPNTFHAPS